MNYFSDVTIAMTILSTLVFTLLRKLRSRVRCVLHHPGGRLHEQQLPEEPDLHCEPKLPQHILILIQHLQVHLIKGIISIHIHILVMENNVSAEGLL